VWKQNMKVKTSLGDKEFQKDLIVWKHGDGGVISVRRSCVSEGLNSVETRAWTFERRRKQGSFRRT